MAQDASSEVPTPAPEASAPVTETQPPTSPTPAPAGSSNGLAIAALVVGIVALVSGWVPFWGVLVGVTAVVLGILGVKKATGKGLAIAGIVTGGVGALWGIFVTVVFIIALSIGASGVSTLQTAIEESNKDNQALIDSKKDFAKGETAVFADKYEVKVDSVEKNYNAGEYYTAGEGMQYIKVTLTVKNISDESQFVSPYDFTVVNNGVAKSASIAPADNELASGEIAPGASTTGAVVYEVNADATDFKLQYTATVYDESYEMKKLTYSLAF